MVEVALIPAAGFGTRVLPASKAIPKELFPIYNKPAIHLVIQECLLSGIKEVILVLSRRKLDILKYFDEDRELEDFLKERGKKELLRSLEVFKQIKIDYVIQEKQKGLGDAVLHGESKIGSRPFAVILPDDLFITKEGFSATKELIRIFEEKKPEGGIILLKKVPKKDVSKYGVVIPDEIKGKYVWLSGVVEKPEPESAPSQLAVVGRYVFSPKIFEWLKTEPEDKTGEIQLAGAIGRFSSEIKRAVLGILLPGRWLDIGSPEGYIKAVNFFARNRKFLDC